MISEGTGGESGGRRGTHERVELIRQPVDSIHLHNCAAIRHSAACQSATREPDGDVAAPGKHLDKDGFVDAVLVDRPAKQDGLRGGDGGECDRAVVAKRLRSEPVSGEPSQVFLVSTPASPSDISDAMCHSIARALGHPSLGLERHERMGQVHRVTVLHSSEPGHRSASADGRSPRDRESGLLHVSESSTPVWQWGPPLVRGPPHPHLLAPHPPNPCNSQRYHLWCEWSRSKDLGPFKSRLRWG